jgi:hypothetical protein
VAVAALQYYSTVSQAYQGNIQWKSGGTLKYALLASGTEDSVATLTSHVHYSDLTTEVASGGGYTTGGVAVSPNNPVTTAANSWAQVWTAATQYPVGYLVIPAIANNLIYQVVAISGTGTSGATTPSFSTTTSFGQTVVDNAGGNQITWGCVGEAVTTFSTSTNPTWASSTITATYGVMYYSTGTGSTSPLIFVNDFGGAISSTNATFTVPQPAPSGGATGPVQSFNFWFWLGAA